MNYLWHVPLAVSTKGNFASYWLNNNADTQHFPMPGGEGQSQKFYYINNKRRLYYNITIFLNLWTESFVVVNDNYRSLVRVLYEGKSKELIMAQLEENIDEISPKSRNNIN